MSDQAPRLATIADADVVADTLAAAFETSPWTEWALPALDRVQRLRRLHYLFAGLVGAATGTTWLMDDGACVAQWIPPSGFVIPPDLRQMVVEEEAVLFGDRLDAVSDLDHETGRRRPASPHWWLATIGTRPADQRRGLGARVLRPVLDRCDHDSVGAALETSTRGNVAFYERLGFEVSASYSSPDGLLPVWLMVRQPRADSLSLGAPAHC